MDRRLLVPLWFCLVGGCVAALPVDVLEIEKVQKVREGIEKPYDFTLAVAVLPGGGPTAETQEVGDGRYAVPFEIEEFRRALRGELASVGLFREVKVISAEPGDKRSILASRARNVGADLVLAVRPLRYEVTYLGRSVWWIPNLFIWALVLVPSWYVPDETYRSDVSLSILLADSGGAELTRGEFAGSQELRLNDFQRGWSFWGPFGGPTGAGHYEDAMETIGPLALNRAKADLIVHLAEALAKHKPRGGAGEETPAPKPAGESAAIVVGVDPPRAAGGEKPCAAADARAFADWLCSASGGMAEEDVLLLLNSEATAEAVLAGCEKLDPKKKTVVFYFAGAGLRKNGKAYLVPEGADTMEPEKNCLELSALAKALAGSDGRERILVVDAGFSGSGPRSTGDGQGELKADGLLPAPAGASLGALFAAGADGEILEG
ncbi:MAG: hypothetical protein ACYS47_12990, partial [Planctomycetota bacterium]